MTTFQWRCAFGGLLVGLGVLIVACGGGGDSGGGDLAAVAALPGSGTPAVTPSTAGGAPAVKITVTGSNAVSYWNEIATNTTNVPASVDGSPAERRPTASVDLADVQIAVYDALVAVVGGYQPFASSPPGVVPDQSDVTQKAAIGAAAYGVLKGLFPNRTAQYQPAYDSFMADLVGGDAKLLGTALGASAASGVLAMRGDDGRSVALAPYVPGTAPGKFRGTNPVNRYFPSIKPLALDNAAQFRAVEPPALTSATYTTDFNETRTFGGATSSVRTDAQLEIAKFHTEAPFRFWPRNLRRFAMTDGTLLDHARLLAMLFVAEADAEIGCFESKYHYEFWRPQSAISLADTDGNDATVTDPAWTPAVPTPNHPEYPAAHACVSGAVTEILKAFYGTDQIAFTFDSTVTGSTHTFASTSDLVQEIRGARIYGGMHFRNSLVNGYRLGADVAQWVVANKFKAR